MKKLTIFFILGMLFAFYPISNAYSEPNDEQELKQESSDVDHEAQEQDGPKKVTERLKGQFNVDDQRIQSLRDKNLGYGEIGIVCSLANQLPGGINDSNVNKIMDMRQSGDKKGWGEIAKSLNLNLGKVKSEVNHMHSSSMKGNKATNESTSTQQSTQHNSSDNAHHSQLGINHSMMSSHPGKSGSK